MQVRRDDARGIANFAFMGSGKTITTLTAIVDLLDGLEAHKVLVTGPLKVAKYVWSDEAKGWEHMQGLRLSVVVGTAAQRLKALRKDSDVYCVNVESLVWLEEELVRQKQLVLHGDHKRSPFDVIVVDESDLFKNRATKRFKTMRRLAKLAKYVILLTGTPATESYIHLWSQFVLLDDGKRLQTGFTSYLDTYFRDVGGQFPKWVLKNRQAARVIQNKIADITFTLTPEDTLQLPAENRIIRYVELDPDEREAYDRLAREAVLPLVSGEVITATSASAIAIKLVQLASGQVYDADRNVHVIHRKKLEEMQLIVSESNGTPLLVSVEFQHDRDLLAREFGAKVFDDKVTTKDSWNAGKYPIMLIHPRSGGHGLNLQHGPGHTLVRYQTLHSLGLFLQLFARLQRPGQKSPFVNHILVMARGTVDEAILELVNAKKFSHDGLLDAMRNYAHKLVL